MVHRRQVDSSSVGPKKVLMSVVRLVLLLVFLIGFSFDSRATSGDVISKTKSPSTNVTGIAWDGKHLWVGDHQTKKLYKIDIKSGKVIQTILSPGHRPGGLAWDGRFLWNLDSGEKKIYKIDTKNDLVLHRFDSPASSPEGLTWADGGLWITDTKTNTLRKLDPDDGTTIKRVAAPSNNITSLAWDGKYLWAADRIADFIYMVDPVYGEVVFVIPTPGPHARGLAYDGRHLVVSDYQTNHIYRLVRDDSKKIGRKLKNTLNMEFQYEIRNNGPSILRDAHVYFAMPGKEPTHRLKTQPSFFLNPTRYVTDDEGRRFAHFHVRNVAAGKSLTVGWKTLVELYDVRHYIFPHKIKSARQIPARIKRTYLKNQNKYSINHPDIRKATKEAIGDEKNLYWQARRIYSYIHKRMHYELSGGWNTAPYLLKRGSGSCSEYSFLFIAMCRAAGIPARYVGSLVVRKDDASFDEVFHRWVEIYLPGHGWLPVDPSRGDKPTEAERGDAFHHLTPDFLITTRSGGPSRYLGWTYNAKAGWICRGRCKVSTEKKAEWTPAK